MAGLSASAGNGAKVPYKKFMLSRPYRSDKVEWERMNEDVIKLYMPMKKGPLMKLVGRVIEIPEERTYRFNPMGSMVWELCDGKNTVEDIKENIVKRTKGNDKDMEKRLIKFLNKLIRNDLITLELT